MGRLTQGHTVTLSEALLSCVELLCFPDGLLPCLGPVREQLSGKHLGT